MDLDALRATSLFAGLADDQLTELMTAGAEVAFEVGDEPFHEGAPAEHWWVLVDGALDLVRHVGREDVVVGRMERGLWSGGFRAWDAQGVYLATGRGAVPGRLLRVPAEALRELIDRWFPFAVHLIGGLYGTARRIESTARQRDALVTLGRLSAGLAHELNNPAAAAVRSVDAIERTCDTLIECLDELALAGTTAEQFTRMEELRRGLVRPARDPLALADREDELAPLLASYGVPARLAAELAEAGVDGAWLDVTARDLGSLLSPVLDWVTSVSSLGALLGEVREATTRVSELVAAVRSYSQADRGSRQPTDVTEGLDSSLVMLGHKLKDGVEVRRDYDPDRPRIDAFPGELNQVWTNLIDNAVDAMEGKGTLTVRVRPDGDHVLVEVSDTGPGMPEEAQARAFEAFYTTKDVGQGTGLGLDIARRIVAERHGGEIVIDSTPGGTTMRVRLPVTHAE
jgi:signal transduction histidine kinase